MSHERPDTTRAAQWHPVDGEHELTLVAIPTAITCARLLVESVTHHLWRAEPDTVDAIRDATDDLVAHAVASSCQEYGSRSWMVFLSVRIWRDAGTITVEVWDRGGRPPDPLLADSQALAAALDWGWATPAHNQRVLWCTVSQHHRANPPWNADGDRFPQDQAGG